MNINPVLAHNFLVEVVDVPHLELLYSDSLFDQLKEEKLLLTDSLLAHLKLVFALEEGFRGEHGSFLINLFFLLIFCDFLFVFTLFVKLYRAKSVTLMERGPSGLLFVV